MMTGSMRSCALAAPRPNQDRTLPPLAITPEIAAAIAAGAWVVFNLSGGKDSGAALYTVNALLDRLGHPRARRMAIHADLGRAEWDATPETVEAIARDAHVPLTVVHRKAGDLIDRWIQRFENGKQRYEDLETYHLIGPWSSASLKFCQSEMKIAIIGPAIARMLRGQQVVSVVGLRRDESNNRAATPIAKPDTRFAKPGNRHGTSITLWHPLADWSAVDVFEAHARMGIRLHEAYTRWQSSRLSCRYCVFASLHDLKASSAAPGNAAVYRELVGIEARSTFPFQPSRWLADVAPHLLSAGLRRDIERAKIDQADRRRIEAAMPHGLRFVKGWPPRVPTMAEAEAIAAARQPILARHRLENRFPTAPMVLDRFAALMATGARKRAP